MSPADGSTTLTLNDRRAEEDRMRTALGLAPEHPQPSRPVEQGHRLKEGQASVAVVGARRAVDASDSLRSRLADLANELKAERGEHAAAEQALADAQRVVQQLQTKLAHAEMAAAEALDVERKARLVAEARLLEITSAPKAESDSASEPRKRGRPPKPRQVTQEPAEPRKRGRPPGQKRVAAELVEPEPVQWWLPDYKAAQAKRGRRQS